LTVLIFGFEPFHEFDENPSELIARRLDGREIEGHRVVGRVLPVSYEQVGRAIIEAIEEAPPALALGFGLAPGRAKITPEKVALNYRYSTLPDNSGQAFNGAPIEPGEADGLFSNLPVEALVEALNARGIPASLSLSAEAYLCNNAMFVIVREARRRGFLGGFIHVPCHQEWVARTKKNYACLPLAALLEAAEFSVSFCLRQARAPWGMGASSAAT
jgi:pyroglutamyl-peptidase